MEYNRTQIASLLTAALLVIAAMTGGVMAAMSYDNETTTTGSVSDWQGGDTVTDLDNSTKQATVEVQSDNATSGEYFTLRAVINDSASAQNNETVYETTQNWTATNSTAGHYETNLTYSEVFDSLERDANETVDVDIVTVWNESEVDEEKATMTIHAQNGDEPLVIADDRAQIKTPTAGTLSKIAFWSSSSEPTDSARVERTVGVTSNTTTVTVAENNANVSDALGAAVENTESGAMTADAYVLMDGELVPVFDTSADAEWLDTTSDTYATADSTGVTIHNVDQKVDSNTSSVDVVVAANANLDAMDAFGMVRDYGGDRTTAISAAWDSYFGNGADFDESALEG